MRELKKRIFKRTIQPNFSLWLKKWQNNHAFGGVGFKF